MPLSFMSLSVLLESLAVRFEAWVIYPTLLILTGENYYGGSRVRADIR